MLAPFIRILVLCTAALFVWISIPSCFQFWADHFSAWVVSCSKRSAGDKPISTLTTWRPEPVLPPFTQPARLQRLQVFAPVQAQTPQTSGVKRLGKETQWPLIRLTTWAFLLKGQTFADWLIYMYVLLVVLWCFVYRKYIYKHRWWLYFLWNGIHPVCCKVPLQTLQPGAGVSYSTEQWESHGTQPPRRCWPQNSFSTCLKTSAHKYKHDTMNIYEYIQNFKTWWNILDAPLDTWSARVAPLLQRQVWMSSACRANSKVVQCEAMVKPVRVLCRKSVRKVLEKCFFC